MASETSRALIGGAITLMAALAVLTWQTVRIPGHAPHRVVAELRLAQAAAVLVTFSAAFLAGVATTAPGPVAAFDMACAVLACGVALMTMVRDPRARLLHFQVVLRLREGAGIERPRRLGGAAAQL